MNPILLLGGVFLLGLAAFDFAQTTVSANKSGPLTRGMARSLWWLYRKVARRFTHPTIQQLSGPLVMGGVALFWIALTSVGWLLIFRSDPASLIMKTTDEPAGWDETYAFVGSALSTAGASNARPASALWDNLSMLAAVNGLIVLTLSVSFVLNVTQTVAKGRGFSALIDVCDPANAENDSLLLPVLSEVCTRINAAPLALYYSALQFDRSLPSSLNWLANRIPTSAARFDQYKRLLLELPYLDVDQNVRAQEFLSALADWESRYSVER